MAELPRQRPSSRLRQSEVAWRGMHQVYKPTMTNFWAQNCWRGSQRIHEPSDQIQCYLGYLYYWPHGGKVCLLLWHPHNGSPEISRDLLSKYFKILEIKCYTVPLGWMVRMFQHGWWKWNEIRWDSMRILHPVVEQHTLDFLCQNHWAVLNPNIQLVGLWLMAKKSSKLYVGIEGIKVSSFRWAAIFFPGSSLSKLLEPHQRHLRLQITWHLGGKGMAGMAMSGNGETGNTEFQDSFRRLRDVKTANTNYLGNFKVWSYVV